MNEGLEEKFDEDNIAPHYSPDRESNVANDNANIITDLEIKNIE